MSGAETREEHEIYYVASGTERAPCKVIFLHGAPGSWKAAVPFLKDPTLASKALLIAPDRPGYGGSKPRKSTRSLQTQANVLLKLLEVGDPLQDAVLVGHSFGGSVAARMAMERDRRIKGVVLVAASVYPEVEGKKWIEHAAAIPPIRWILPHPLKVAREEAENLQAELETMRPLWSRVAAHITVVQGLADEVVDPRSADFIERQELAKKPRIIRVPGEKHLILWTRQDIVTEAILSEMQRRQAD